MTVWYRYEDVHYAPPADEWGEYRGHGTVQVQLREFEEVRRTPKGVWLNLGWRERFMLFDARKRFACSTKEEAKVSFIARKKRQIGIYQARIDSAKEALAYLANRL